MERLISLPAMGSILRPEVLVLVIPAVVFLTVIGAVIGIAISFAKGQRSRGGK